MFQEVKKSTKVFITLAVVTVACLITIYGFQDYLLHPWTRDGQVRAQVILVTPRVSGPIVMLPITDNQTVKQGDLLFKIDTRTFQTAVNKAVATLEQAKASADEAKNENERIQGIYKRDKEAISERKVSATQNAMKAAIAAVQAAEANLESAKLDLEFTEIRASLDGYVTNLNLQLGSQAVENQPALALVDIKSFWVHGFFKETQIENIHPGDKAVIRLMSYPGEPLQGIVDSLGWGIAQQNGSPGVDLLPNINPSFDWIRLAQRIPVRIHLTNVPEDVSLRVGSTASVFIKGSQKK